MCNVEEIIKDQEREEPVGLTKSSKTQSNRITAAEARAFAGPTVEEIVDDVYILIRKLAADKKREARLTGEFWVNGGYSRTPEWSKACDILRNDGFTVDFFYEERQFVNMYTVVKW